MKLYKNSLLRFFRKTSTYTGMMLMFRQSSGYQFRDPVLRTPPSPAAEDEPREPFLEFIRNNVRLVDHLSKVYGFEVYYFWQPVLINSTQLSEYE